MNLRERCIELLSKVYDDDNLCCDDREIDAVESFAREIRNEVIKECTELADLERHPLCQTAVHIENLKDIHALAAHKNGDT